MTIKALPINEVYATGQPAEITCYGLGSCIGLFVTDRLSNLSGGAHIPLPDSGSAGEFMAADMLIDQLLHSMQQQGSDLSCLRAKIVGGAKVYESVLSIGDQNIDVVLRKLQVEKIFVAAKDVGGRIARTARFNTTTGEVLISTSESKKYRI